MKKNLMVMAAILISTSSFSATNDSFILRGSLDSYCEIDVQATAKATTLDLAAGENQSVVANVEAFANDPKGMEIQIASEKAGQVVHKEDDSHMFPYQLRYIASEGNDNVAIGLAQQNVFEKLDERATHGSLRGSIDITLEGDASKKSGTYEDVVYLSCSLPGEGA